MTRIIQYKRKSNLHYTDEADYLPQLLPDCNASHHLKTQRVLKIVPSKTPEKKVELIKRVSPFLLLAIGLPFVIVWFLISTDHTPINKFFVASLFVVAEVNLLFIDFALWNYFEGRQKWRIWLLETCVIIALIFCML